MYEKYLAKLSEARHADAAEGYNIDPQNGPVDRSVQKILSIVDYNNGKSFIISAEFTAGELSPRMEGRTDFQNIIVQAQL